MMISLWTFPRILMTCLLNRVGISPKIYCMERRKRKNIFLKHFYLFLSPLLERNINSFDIIGEEIIL